MERPARRPPAASALAGLALLQRYSIHISRVADLALTVGGARNLDIQLLTTLHRVGSASPSDLAARIRRPRSTMSRSIARALNQGLVERSADEHDRRRCELRLTPRGEERVAVFAGAMGSFFLEGTPVVKDILVRLGRPDGTGRPTPLPPLEVANLLGAAGAGFVDEVTPVVGRYRLTEAVDRYAVVLLADRGHLRPAQFADELLLTPAGTSSMLDRLEARGLVTRESGAVTGDRRGVLVTLTPEGSRAAHEVLRVFRRHQDALLDALERTLAVDVPADT